MIFGSCVQLVTMQNVAGGAKQTNNNPRIQKAFHKEMKDLI